MIANLKVDTGGASAVVALSIEGEVVSVGGAARAVMAGLAHKGWAAFDSPDVSLVIRFVMVSLCLDGGGMSKACDEEPECERYGADHSRRNTSVRSFQNLWTEEICTFSSGEWAPRMLGPKEIISTWG